MGPLLVEAAGLMWGHVAVASPGPGGGHGASRLPSWGLWGAAGSGGAVAPAAWGNFGVVRQRHALGVISCGFATWILRFCIPKVWMLRGSVFTRSLLGKTIQLRFFAVSVLGAMARALADIERKTASLGQSWACPGVSAGLSAQFAVLCCGVLKGAAGGHDDVCFAFGRNPACR